MLLKINFYQNLFAIVTWIVIPTSFIYIPDVIKFIKYSTEHGLSTPDLSDIAIVIASAIFQFFLFLIVKTLSGRFVYQYLDDKYQGDERLRKANGIIKLIYDNVFYTTSTVFAFYHFSNQAIPKSLFGQFECDALFTEFPNKPSIPYFNEFYLYQLGNHLYRLVNHAVIARKEPKFYEMFLHHYVAFWLIFYSYLLNYTLMGGIVLITHDIGDIFLTFGRAYDSFKNKIKSIWFANYILILASWIYTRLYVFPKCLIWNCWKHLGQTEVWHLTGRAFTWQFSLTFVLLVLHAYWISTFIIIGVQAITKKNMKLSAHSSRPHTLKKSE